MKNWWPARRQAALIAAIAILATAAVSIAYGVIPGYAAVYVAIALYGLGSAAAIPVQVLAGCALVGALLVGPAAAEPLALLPLVVGVVATAELLAVVARLDAPIERPAGDLLLRAGAASGVAGVLYGAIALIGTLPGPSGSAAVALGSAAALIAALLLARSTLRWRRTAANPEGDHPRP